MLLMDTRNVVLIVLLISKHILGLDVSYNQPRLCPDASWTPNATTFASNETMGSSPFSIFVNTNNTVYATSSEADQILVWSEGSTDPKKMNYSILIDPLNLFVSVTEDIYIYNAYNDNKNYSGLNTTYINKSSTSRDCSYNPYGLYLSECIEYRQSDNCNCYYCLYYVYCNWFGFNCRQGPGYSPDRKRCNKGRHRRSIGNPGAINGEINSNSDNQNPNTVNHGQVYKLSLHANKSTIVMNISGSCASLFVIDSTIYCSMGDHHQVVKNTSQYATNNLNIVAGNGSRGSTRTMLNEPRGIFVDTDFLYVADSGNDRIQRFRLNESHGETVAGNESNKTMSLSSPTGVALDANGSLFIVDSGNHRIVESGPNGFRCIVGCSNSPGLASDQLSRPWSLSFDSHGNIFVSDWENNRIQKFILETNSFKNLQKNVTIRAETTTNKLINNETTTTAALMNETTANQKVTSETTISKTPPPAVFVPTCNGHTSTGITCDDLKSPCKLQKPCQNNGNCTDNKTMLTVYFCSCSPDFDGNMCQNNLQPCEPNPCWNNGTCEKLNKTFRCHCQDGWTDDRCETKINNCTNVTCFNNGVCRPLFMNYTCECLGESYSGRHCEITATKIKIYKIVSKSFAYVGIIALIIVTMFIVIMDILKYCFGIDPVHRERERIRRKKRDKHRKSAIQRFIYVNTPTLNETA